MREITIQKTIYKYSELNDKAKNKVKEHYREITRTREEFVFRCLNEIEKYGFDNVELFYSLGYSQGDGASFTGTIEASQIFEIKEIKDYIDGLLEPNKELITKLLDYVSIEKVIYNYQHCYTVGINFIYTEELNDNSMYKYFVSSFENTFRRLYISICQKLEKDGYDYFYNISDKEIEEYYEDDEFFEDGELYV